MKIVGEIELKNINEVVINRAAVWERITSTHWQKRISLKGNLIKVHIKDNAQMMKLINGLLDRRLDPKPLHIGEHVNFPLLVIVCEDRAYRCWPSGETLNIVRKGLK